MTIDVLAHVVHYAPRRKAVPVVANHHRLGWVLFYRDDHGRAQRFITGAATERQAIERGVAWLLLLRDLRCC